MRDRDPISPVQQTFLPIPQLEITRPRTSELAAEPREHSENGHLPPWDIVKAYIFLYLKHCNYQPLPLFTETLLNKFTSRDPELLLAIIALASRFDTVNYNGRNAPSSHSSDEFTSPAKEIIMRRVAHGPVELSTIQTLCLLSLAELNSTCPDPVSPSYFFVDNARWKLSTG